MSRFVEILNSHDEEFPSNRLSAWCGPWSISSKRIPAISKCHFPYFVRKMAPISRVKSLLDYEVTFIGEIRKGSYKFP